MKNLKCDVSSIRKKLTGVVPASLFVARALALRDVFVAPRSKILLDFWMRA